MMTQDNDTPIPPSERFCQKNHPNVWFTYILNTHYILICVKLYVLALIGTFVRVKEWYKKFTWNSHYEGYIFCFSKWRKDLPRKILVYLITKIVSHFLLLYQSKPLFPITLTSATICSYDLSAHNNKRRKEGPIPGVMFICVCISG